MEALTHTDVILIREGKESSSANKKVIKMFRLLPCFSLLKITLGGEA